jgi:predicted aspartyl protease
MALYRDDSFAEAAADFNRIAQSGGPDAAKAMAWLARTNLKLGLIHEAESAAQKAVELSPNLATAHSALGEVYFRQGRFTEAEREFLNPLKAGVADPRAYYGEAMISITASNHKHGKRLIDKAHMIDPDDPDIREAWSSTLPRVERAALEKPAPQPARSGEAQPKDAAAEPPIPPPSERRCRLVTQVTSTEAPLERLMLDANLFRGFGLLVKVNGTPSKLLLDTGATGILINSRVAQRANVRHLGEHKFGGIGDQGGASGYVGYADSIQVGGLEFRGCTVAVIDKKRSMGEDGLIGSDVFQKFLVDIDFPDEKLKLSELPKSPDSDAAADKQNLALESAESAPPPLTDRYIAPEMQNWERFYRIGHYILLPTYVNTTANTRLFLVDTGAYDTNLSVDFARQVTKVHTDEFTTVTGISGKVKNVYMADRVKVGFPYSKLMQQVDNLVAFDLSDMSNSAGTEVSGILGFSMLFLMEIKIDYRDGLASFTYFPNKLH